MFKSNQMKIKIQNSSCALTHDLTDYLSRGHSSNDYIRSKKQ